MIEMMDNSNKNLIDFCRLVVNWIKKMAIITHNNNIKYNQKEYESGLAFAYYEVLSLMQMQAEAFSIPLSIVGLEYVKDEDFLSTSLIVKNNEEIINYIPNDYVETVIGWMRDNIYLIKENAMFYKQVVDEKVSIERKAGEILGCEYYRGKFFAYNEILTFMLEQAKKIGISLKDLNLDDVNPCIGDDNRLQI